ncbi:MAG: hypothetical protein A2504_14070 [Bdellovibrionales bacterium RIFOXYD12_FULL_39_22]|nr:MAG: hypothetical protein A2385_04505 [Bdellovibrionales bacterium RIFOXYB1_FULL_39_21]OFZ43409.1 MAG: hypothetical protein A2485_13020 [Bdellovibrionales bacterium RIFOXYC12_FULL_39_17]OFZ46952.1 MAG: hypothetical protein A2404_00080 [Bdellovibrionales bacterium RIFOXYC1_FULL_39_130]OFZ76149.1 MAG: hypothetical protein A2560_07330 [Bdellovibrionales bacterium RIFOXYD1_FULL_39_84]OFZ94384.1 MAG: hypothetical protein A2504_14070 [Bdellovibrionales bacterium RIFOXYD12_FULL_39_22]HLE10576.1 TR
MSDTSTPGQTTGFFTKLVEFLSDDTFSLDQLTLLWNGHDPEYWSKTVKLYHLFAERVLSFASPLLSYDIVSEGIKFFPQDAKLRQLQALTLARINVSDRANQVILELFNEGHRDKETLGLLARTNKDLWQHETNLEKKNKYKETAVKYYLEAYNLYKSSWTGINAATLFYISKNIDQAIKIAKELKTNILAEFQKYAGEDGEYWTLATLGEASLILHEFDEAIKYYGEAQKHSQKKYGNINSTWKNAQMLIDSMAISTEVQANIIRSFDFPEVLIFSGHMVDGPNKARQRFPESISDQVYEEIFKRISGSKNLITFSSLANGADILFVEAAEKLEAKINIVLPCSPDLFNKTSVLNYGNINWSERFYRIMDSAIIKHVLHRNTNQLTSSVYTFANEITYGLGRINAKDLNAQVKTMAVLSHLDNGRPGGARSVVDFWRSQNEVPDIINLDQVSRKKIILQRPGIIADDEKKSSSPEDEKRKRMAVLFADTENYSKLKDEEFPLFEKYILGLAQRLIEERKYCVCSKNSWGDALFLVFENIKEAGMFALEFTEEIAITDWAAKGFSQTIRLRIALHAGIIFETTNPINGQITHNGEDVCRTARIEGVTPSGQVFASMEFATLAAAEHITEFECTYVGKMVMPKRYGIFPTYHVRKAF